MIYIGINFHIMNIKSSNLCFFIEKNSIFSQNEVFREGEGEQSGAQKTIEGLCEDWTTLGKISIE
jgi:hypothetical protein